MSSSPPSSPPSKLTKDELRAEFTSKDKASAPEIDTPSYIEIYKDIWSYYKENRIASLMGTGKYLYWPEICCLLQSRGISVLNAEGRKAKYVKLTDLSVFTGN